jgi:biotin carboxyl carrier protein
VSPEAPKGGGTSSDKARNLFREEALEFHRQGRMEGEALHISPRWTQRVYWALLAMSVATLVASAVLTLYEYASGPAVMRVDDRLDVTANSAGTVLAVMAQPGQRVTEGQLLVKLYDSQELNDLSRLKHEFELQLVRLLTDPTDTTAREALIGLRTQRDLASAQVEERWVHAPHAGTVSDIRIRPGELIGAGDRVLSLVGDGSTMHLTALIPGQYRPLLRAKESMRLEVTGFEYCYQDLEIESFGDAIVGPDEVKRYLGQELADAVPVTGPVVLVQAALPVTSLICANQTVNFYNGMTGTAQARVRLESVLVTFVPALRYLLGGQG